MSGAGTSAGFIYFAFGQPYLDEMRGSLRTLLQHNPQAKVCLVTDEAGQRYMERCGTSVALDQIRCVTWDRSESYWVLRLRMYDVTPYDKTIYLDDDTYVAGEIQHLFDLLDTFDFVAVPDESHPARGFILGLKGGYAALNYYNCGFFMFRKSAPAQRLFEQWRREYVELAPLEPADQGALVRALVKTDLRFITLPKEYNLRLIDKCASFQGRVKIIHGRARDPEQLTRMLNDIEFVSHGSRVWIPNLQRVIRASAFARFAQLLSLFNLDTVQRAALGRTPRMSVAQNFRALGSRVMERLARRSLALVGAGSRTVERPEQQEVDEPVVTYLLGHYPIHSFLECGGAGTYVRYLRARGVEATTLIDRGVASRRFDLVWCEVVPEVLTHRQALSLIETIAHCAGRLVLLSLIGFEGSRPHTAYSHSGFQEDWYWTQLITDRGFYFDPYLTLTLRDRSTTSHFRRTGLVFERVQPLSAQEEPTMIDDRLANSLIPMEE